MITLGNTTSSISKTRNLRYSRAQVALKRLLKILTTDFHVSRIILIGSLSEKHRFGFHSDIDLCVEGLSNTDYFKAVGMLLLESGEFDIDIIRIEDANPKMMEHIKKGEVLYEKGRAIS